MLSWSFSFFNYEILKNETECPRMKVSITYWNWPILDGAYGVTNSCYYRLRLFLLYLVYVSMGSFSMPLGGLLPQSTGSASTQTLVHELWLECKSSNSRGVSYRTRASKGRGLYSRIIFFGPQQWLVLSKIIYFYFMRLRKISVKRAYFEQIIRCGYYLRASFIGAGTVLPHCKTFLLKLSKLWFWALEIAYLTY